MSTQKVEEILARLYSDNDYLELFMKNKNKVLSEYILTTDEIEAMLSIDTSELILATNSYNHKRSK